MAAASSARVTRRQTPPERFKTGRDHATIHYLKNAFAEAEHVDFHDGLEKQSVVTADGKDITEMVEKAVAWLTENTF